MTAQEKETFADAIEGVGLDTQDLMQDALALAELLEAPKEKPREDGGRPLLYVNAIWEDAAKLIAEVQKSAKYCVDDLIHLKTELEWCIEDPTTSDDKVSPKPPVVDGSKLTPEEKGIMPNVPPETMVAVSRIIEALPGVKPHIREDGVIEISL